MKVIFMGSPAFAAPTLQALITSSQHDVVAVYTNPPRLYGRGRQIRKTTVHQIADLHQIPVFTPNKLTQQEVIEQFNAIEADIVVVAAYGKILRKPILEGKRYGCLNIHPSKLPRWRGAAPIQRTIIAGDKESAVCIMQMDEGLDTGDIILQKDFKLPEKMITKELHDFTANLGAELMLKALDMIKKGDVKKIKQDGEPTYADKLSAEIEKIDWNKNAFEINCLVRGLSPSPGAYFMFKNTKIKIITARFDMNINNKNIKPGTVIDSNNLTIQCKRGVLIPELVQREGKKMIYTQAFLRGFEILEGALL